ncbi:MAG TPA: RHS repeat-associated core domain-containing protein [Saprospiraceae bacterium]|nr:RHS repeat-associated core domain-containing protein [Saprospiraceae bacterium]
MQWRSNVNGSCLTRQQYRFTYDYANRLLTANHFTHNGAGWVNTNNYSESNIAYDLNGNIKTYTRRGLTAPATFGIIDQLTYTYGDAARPDRLTNVSDAGSAAKGFKFTSGAAAYTYDLNGNLTQDNHKSLSFQYNYLNLPNYITNPGGSEITITYTADGEKLSKTSPTETRNYVSGIEYLGNALDAIYHGEGRCTPNGASAFYYEYTIKDHLGNARINFRANGAAVTFLQELHYYPFGMLMEGIGTAQVTNNGYKYNGKELNEDLGLNLHDYGARWYDASLGRWWSVDLLVEKYSNSSPFSFSLNNPIRYLDFAGMAVINGYQEARDHASDRLNMAKENLNSYSGEDKKALKKLKREVKDAQRAFDRIDAKYQSVETAIRDLKEYNSQEYKDLNSLQDAEGNFVNVYIQEEDHLADDNGQTLSGKTETLPDRVLEIINAETGDKKLVASVQSRHGSNTATIVINSNEPSKGETLAHEGGHVLYNVPNLATYLLWRKANPNKDGHAKGDPSGERAFKEQGIYLKNKKLKK